MRKTKTFFWVCGFLVAVLFMGCSLLCSGIQNNPEDLKLFTNGTIYLNGETKASNLLVKDGVVAAYDVAPAKYPKRQSLTLRVVLLIPVFVTAMSICWKAPTSSAPAPICLIARRPMIWPRFSRKKSRRFQPVRLCWDWVFLFGIMTNGRWPILQN